VRTPRRSCYGRRGDSQNRRVDAAPAQAGPVMQIGEVDADAHRTQLRQDQSWTALAVSCNEIEATMVDRRTGHPLAECNALFAAGPAAHQPARERLDPTGEHSGDAATTDHDDDRPRPAPATQVQPAGGGRLPAQGATRRRLDRRRRRRSAQSPHPFEVPCSKGRIDGNTAITECRCWVMSTRVEHCLMLAS
jgi:hypothetical protein